jgi:hypothetical protein
MDKMTKKELIAKAMEIPGMVSEWDLDLIYDQSQEYVTKGGFAIEIGGWKGRSTYVIASVCKEKGAQLYELDTFSGVEDSTSRKNQPDNLNGYYEAFINPNFMEIMKNNLVGLPVIYKKGDSKETIKEIPNRSIDYCFIDGNHDSPFVDEDIENCLRKVKIGGLVTGHDHGNPDTNVHQAVDRILGTDFRLNVRPTIGDPKYCLTIWSHVVDGSEIPPDAKL